MKNFADRLVEAVKAKGNPICVGLDPRLAKIPGFIRERALEEANGNPLAAAAESIIAFDKGLIDAVADIVPVVKPQIAFYEMFGAEGMRAYETTLKYAKSKGLLTIADAKRGDIGSTVEAYAKEFLGEVQLGEGENEVVTPVFDADALTVNAYFGWDGVKPFIDELKKYDKGIFALVKTSNQSSGDLQNLELKSGGQVYEVMGGLVESWGADEIGESGYSSVGAVVGATYPEEAAKLRKMMPNTIFLVPGYGAQGGGAEDVKPCFNSDGLGAVVNSSRGIIYAYESLDGFDAAHYPEAARKACELMRDDLKNVI